MSMNKELFDELYHKKNLSKVPYYLYGSGSCSDEIYSYVEEKGYVLPIRVFDMEYKEKENYIVTPISDYSEHLFENELIVVASLSFYNAISEKINKYVNIPGDQIVSLVESHKSDQIWLEYDKLCSDLSKVKPLDEYLDHGFYAGGIASGHLKKLFSLFEDYTSVKLVRSDCETGYLPIRDLSDDRVLKMNELFEYIKIDDSKLKVITDCVESIYDEVKCVLGSDWHVVACKLWKGKESSIPEFGAQQWHSDGFNNAIKKILVYVSPPSKDSGTTLIQLDNGETTAIEGPAGTWLLFNNSEIIHKGTRSSERKVVELTISRCIEKPASAEMVSKGGYCALYPELPWRRSISKVNLGSGVTKLLPEWVNYDALSHPNINTIYFTTDTVLPHRDNSIKLVYSSHHFEHLNDATLDRMIKESHRILDVDGDFVVKLPDFELLLDKLSTDESFLDILTVDEFCLDTWRVHNVEDSPLNRVSFAFCGYWNRAYGDHFSRNINEDLQAYHGPVIAPNSIIKDIFQTESLHSISQKLRAIVEQQEDMSEITYNHQNAWSRQEFISLMSKHGFVVTSTDFDTIKEQFPDIPQYEAMKEYSMYMSFKKK